MSSLSIRTNVRPLYSQWIPTKLTTSPTSSYSAPTSVSIPIPTFLGVTFDRSLSFSKHVSSLKAKFFPRLKALHCISASSRGLSLFCIKLFFGLFLLMLYPDSFLSVTNITKLERLHRAASRAISGCILSSPIPLLLSEASLLPLQVTLTHFTLTSYERTLRLPTFFLISGLASLGVEPRHSNRLWCHAGKQGEGERDALGKPD